MPKKLTQEECIDRMIQTHGTKYDYSLVRFTNSKSKIDIICPIHGKFTQTPEAHYSGQGCPNCRLTKTIETNLKKHGVKWNSQIPSKIEKTKKTNLERYGHENIAHGILKEKVEQTNLERYSGHPRKNRQVQEKQKATNLERYGVECVTQSPLIRNKQKQTNLKKYGFVNPLQNHEVYEKAKQTCLKRFGYIKPLQSPVIKQQRIESNINKYGVKNPTQLVLKDILVFIEDYNWLFDQYILQNKTALQISDELNISDVTIGTYLRDHEIAIKYSYSSSYKALMWLEQLNIPNMIIEYPIPGTKYKGDGYCAETNTIYEFYGDYWHGNPEIYKPDTVNVVVGKIMRVLYENTITREELIKSMGYNIITMWEHTFNNQTEFKK